MHWLALFLLLATPLSAQDFTGLARVLPEQTAITTGGQSLSFKIGLSQPVPYRIYTLDAPRRLVVDFREADFTGLQIADFQASAQIIDARTGPVRDGWSRMVLDLAAPLTLRFAGLLVDQASGAALLQVQLEETSPDDFAQTAGAPDLAGWDLQLPPVTVPAPTGTDDLVTVVIDPGHGGIDPGATQGGVHEADLMLALGIEVADALNRSGLVRAVLTRDRDHFVPLDARMTIARQVGAQLLVSLHADALEEDMASGASVYTLSTEGEGAAARRMAERHERGDLLAGVDLSEQDDRVASVLMDLARAETSPQADRFADRLIAQLRQTGARLNSRPRRSGRLAVLNAADFASVLVEVGFLTSARDREMLSSPQDRAPLVQALVQAVLLWAADEATRAPLVRQ